MTGNDLLCYRCGTPLSAVPLPLSRREECPSCRAELHVCRMCVHYAPRLIRACDQDDAPDVRDKEAANFCDYFQPSPSAFEPERAEDEAAARAELARLFGEDDGSEPEPASAPTEQDAALREAEKLFKR